MRELKEHLSEYLDRAARGEVIRVTDRGRPKAILGPLPGRLLLDEGVAQKWIRPGREAPAKPVSRQRSRTTIASSLREDRGE